MSAVYVLATVSILITRNIFVREDSECFIAYFSARTYVKFISNLIIFG